MDEDDPYMAHLDMMGELINSDSLSLDAWKHMIDTIPSSFDGSFDAAYRLIRLILEYNQSNKEVLIEIVEWMLSAYPGVASLYDVDGVLPIHAACFNTKCPSPIVEMLAKDYPEALGKTCLVCDGEQDGLACHGYDGTWYFDGLPISYYLARTDDLHISTVKLLVELYPDALMKAEAYEARRTCYPIHAITGNQNISHLKEVLEYVIECEPSSIRLTVNEDENQRTPLNMACSNADTSLEMVKLLVNAWPEGTRHRDNSGEFGGGSEGYLPIHNLCNNYNLDAAVSRDILQVLIDADPSSPKERDSSESYLPIHYAAGYGNKSLEFCKLLIKAYPESLKIESGDDRLPLHEACIYKRVELVEYLLQEDPESINVRSIAVDDLYHSSIGGLLPIHLTEDAETIKVLLKHDPNVALKTNHDGMLPLQLVCGGSDVSLSSVKVLYDAYPEAIGAVDHEGRTLLDLARENNRQRQRQDHNASVISFLEKELVFAQQSRDMMYMTLPDEEGYLPLHRALLQGDITLGSIKLLVRGNLSALQVVDRNGVRPIHIACRSATADVVKFLMEAPNGLDVCDTNKDYPIHYACRAANFDVIKYLVERNTPVSERNADNKLPFHLLLENEDEQVRKSPAFTEACWHLLRAYPETVMLQTKTIRVVRRNGKEPTCVS